MARPPGALRVAVLGALREGPGTLRDICERAQVGYVAARYTVQNALRSGDLQICGQEKRMHSKAWLAIYELSEPPEEECPTAPEPTCAGHANLGAALSCWGR